MGVWWLALMLAARQAGVVTVTGGGERLASEGAADADPLSVALSWTTAVTRDRAVAEACAVEAVRRLLHRDEPAWLRSGSARQRLTFFMVEAVLQSSRRA